jgi:hypothetical protein
MDRLWNRNTDGQSLKRKYRFVKMPILRHIHFSVCGGPELKSLLTIRSKGKRETNDNEDSRLLGCYAVQLLLRTDVLEERIAYIITVTRISELGITLAVTSSRSTLRSNNIFVRFEVFTAVTMKNGVFWVVTRNIPDDTILNNIFVASYC